MSARRDRWHELGDRVFVRRHETLDVNSGLILGDDACVVVDTRGSAVEANQLLHAVRSMTRLPYVVVNTHAHFDHCFGNATFAAAQPGCEIWSSAGCAATLAGRGEQQRVEMAHWLRKSGEFALAGQLSEVQIMPPNRTFQGRHELSLGGRRVLLHEFGRGHTDHDVVVEVPDVGVLFVGDLVEQGAAPSFDDAYPQEWPTVLGQVLNLAGDRVVPGHGDPVDTGFVARQRAQIDEIAQLARTLVDATADAVQAAARRSALGPVDGLLGLTRALELTGGEFSPQVPG